MSATREMATIKRAKGGMFLLEDLDSPKIFTPGDFTLEQKPIARMTMEFAEEKILTQIPAIEAKDNAFSKQLMHELELLSVDIPEAGGGRDLVKVTLALIAQKISVLGSFSVTSSAHSFLGILASYAKLSKQNLINTVTIGREISAAMVEAGQYVM